MYVLAIDFGTSATVAMVRDPGGRVRPLLFDGSPLLPSAVYLGADGVLRVGRDAERQARVDPGRFEPHPKRHVGHRRIRLGGRRLPVTEVVAEVFAHVAREAYRSTGGHPAEVRLTHPVRWRGRRQVTALATAAGLAGLTGVRLVEEPVAAAAYVTAVLGHHVPIGGFLAVYDLGGGSFDATVLARAPAGFVVVADESRADLGGPVLDEAVAAYLADAYGQPKRRAPAGAARRLLEEDARLAKELLSRAETAYIHLPDLPADAALTRSELNQVIQPYLARGVQSLARTITAARLQPQDLYGIFLIGGSSRIPLVAQSVWAALGVTPMVLEEPETVVAEGALHVGAEEQAPRSAPPPRSGPPTSAPPTSAPPTSAPPRSAPPTSAPPTSAPPTSAPPYSWPPAAGTPSSGAPVTGEPLTGAPGYSYPGYPAQPYGQPGYGSQPVPAPADRLRPVPVVDDGTADVASSRTQRVPATDPESEAGRHFVGEMPARVRIGQEFSVIVEIRGRPADPGQHGQPLHIVAERSGTPLWIIVRVGPGLEVLANSEDTMFVWPDRDSTPARFALRALSPGMHTVRVSAWSGGTFLAELTLQTSAAADRVDADPRRVSVAMGSTRPRAGDVTLLVEVEGGRYSFRWLTDGFLSSRALAEPLAGPPDAAVTRTVETLRRIVEQESGYSPSNARRWVTETGVGLWQDMMPDPIKDQYWHLRHMMRALYIACSDDWMPWELLYPRAPQRDDGFLVQQLPVLRQVPDQHHSPAVRLGGAHCVVPPNSPSNAKEEVDAVRRTLLGAGVEGISDRDIDSLDDLLDMLDSGSTGLLHFACHNGYSVESGGSFIRMAGGNFIPALLNSIRTDATLARTSPLIFLNACRSAGIAPYYTRMMGWAEQFMSAGAGAFVGTLWPVETGRAAAFAEAFYGALLAGETLGVAGLRARKSIEDPADPSWLAYTIYGNPNAVATLRK